MFTVSSNFIGKFKVGDNINYNLEILQFLYKEYDKLETNERILLCKPIIVLLVSILEAILYDFHFRVTFHTSEGIRNIGNDILNYIRNKKIDELGKYIASVRKHNLFDTNNKKFYEDMDNLRKLRNRIHIQNEKNHFEPDDYEAFNEKRKILAEKVVEKTLKTMATKYSRGERFDHVDDFELPWDEHFDQIEEH